jgi:hypothetical protein
MNDLHPEVRTVMLGGESRRLKLGPGAFRRAELRGSTVRLGALDNPSLADLTHLVWVGLLAGDATLEEETVLGWLDESEDEGAVIGEVVKALKHMAEDLSRAMSDVPEAKKKPRRKTR